MPGYFDVFENMPVSRLTLQGPLIPYVALLMGTHTRS